MSRIGIRPIKIEPNVQIKIEPTHVEISAQGLKTIVQIPGGISVKQKGEQLIVERENDTQAQRSLHGTVRSLLKNAVYGLTNGFEKRLEMVGIGYRAALEGETLVLQVGFTHSVRLEIDPELKVKVEKNVIIVSGHDKQKVGQFCAEIRAIRPPEPYRGKGIRYQGEVIRMKQGKAATRSTA